MKMRVKQMVVMLLAILTVPVFVGCASKPARSPRDEAKDRAMPIWCEPAERQPWVDSVPQYEDTLSFVGSAGRYATATGNAGARYYAEENGRAQLVDFYGVQMVNKSRTYVATFGISSEVLSPQIVGQQLNERIAQNAAQALGPRDYHTCAYFDDTYGVAYEVYVLMQVDKAIVRQVIDNYGREQAEEYRRKALAEQDVVRRQLLENAANFFGGDLSSTLDF